MKIDVTVRGLPELLKDFQRLNEAAQGRIAKNMAMAGARVAAKHARDAAPVETGTLKKSIKAKRYPKRLDKGQALALVNAGVFYARFAEYGTAYQSAKPFLRPAVDSGHSEIIAKMSEIGEKGLAREIAKQTEAEDQGEQ